MRSRVTAKTLIVWLYLSQKITGNEDGEMRRVKLDRLTKAGDCELINQLKQFPRT